MLTYYRVRSAFESNRRLVLKQNIKFLAIQSCPIEDDLESTSLPMVRPWTMMENTTMA